MGGPAVDQLLYLMEEAFGVASGPWEGGHSFLANLRNLTPEDWLWLPPGGARTIRDIVVHVGECKYVYDNHAFGDASMRWDRPGTVPTVFDSDSAAEVKEWLKEGHRRFRESVARLDDYELVRLRRVNWGEMKETRWIIRVMIEHDLYHAGEINHIRALRQGNDRWAWEQEAASSQ